MTIVFLWGALAVAVIFGFMLGRATGYSTWTKRVGALMNAVHLEHMENMHKLSLALKAKEEEIARLKQDWVP